jgi:hypothetical protein
MRETEQSFRLGGPVAQTHAGHVLQPLGETIVRQQTFAAD